MALAAALAGLAVQVDKPARMTLLNPFTRDVLKMPGPPGEDGKPGPDLEAWIDLLSNSSTAAKEHDRRMQDRNLRNVQLRRRLTGADMDADTVEKLVALTTGWQLCTLDGRPLDLAFSKETAREVYSLPELSWLRDQCAEFVSDLGNFQKSPARDSSASPSTSSGSQSGFPMDQRG